MPTEKVTIRESGWSGLFKKEDWLAVWLGFLIIVLMLLGLQVNLPTFKWTTDGEYAGLVGDLKPAVEALAKSAAEKGDAALATATESLKTAMGGTDRKAIGAAAAKLADAGKKASDSALKTRTDAITKELIAPAGQLPNKVFAGDNIMKSVYIGIGYLVLASLGIACMGGSVAKFLIGFPFVFAMAWAALVIAGNYSVTYWGLEFVIWALFLGLFISNFIGVPEWMKEAVRTEYYIKTGLVILGAGILFGEIMQAGAYGIVQALLNVICVWYVCWWMAKKLQIDDDFAAILASGVSICGVSAAIATCGAIQGDKKKLSYVTSIVLVCAVPMLVLMPWAIKAFHIPDVVGGAWMGGTLDTSGSVVAAGALVSDAAMKTGVIVKFSQNVLIGLAAFILAVVWTFRKGAETGERPGAGVIWERFPKFVLGFLIASIVFSFFLSTNMVKAVSGPLTGLRTLWFALAFTCIGLETKFTELAKMEGGRPAVAFLGAQVFNVIWTLILAYLLFGGVLFPAPVIK